MNVRLGKNSDEEFGMFIYLFFFFFGANIQAMTINIRLGYSMKLMLVTLYTQRSSEVASQELRKVMYNDANRCHCAAMQL